MNTIVIPNSQTLISAVLKEIDTTNDDLSDNLIVFAGKRPSYFLLDAISKIKKSSYIPPVIFSIDEFIDYCYENELKKTDTKLDTLSCCKILKDLNDKNTTSPHPEDINSFIPLAIKIYSACEELMIEGISLDRLKIDDVLIDATLTQVQIKRLSEIYKDFYETLENQNYSTRSLRYKKVSEEDIKLDGFRKIIFAGFFAITRSEKKIFDKFKDDNRAIFIFQDEIAKSHILKNTYSPPPISLENITIYECPDGHSQVFKLAEILKKDYEAKKEGETFAVIAPSPDIIIPLINSIHKDFGSYNVSMGYPLIKTPLYSFIKSLSDVLISMKDDKVYIPDYLNFVLHPYTKNITLNNNAEITRRAFHSIEEAISKERFKNFVKLKEIEDLKGLKEIEKDLEKNTSITKHIKSIHTKTILAFKDLKSIKDFAGRLKPLTNYIYTHSTAKRHILFFPYCEYMLDALTELEQSLIAQERFKSIQEYFDFFKRFISLYKVPFKGTPIKDLQILGFLEARNLKFDNLYILDVNEGILPNTDREDTILPFDVRLKLKLPTYKDKERLFDYYLKTAIISSKRATLFYVEDNKRQRSRLIEQIIWQKQRQDKDTQKEPFTPLSYSFTLKPYKPQGITKDDTIREHLKNMTYSASAVDTYYQCPLRFYYRYVLLPKEDEGVYEELEGKDVGIIVHEILKTYFDDRDITFRKDKFNKVVDEAFRYTFGSELKGETLIVKYQIQKRLAEFVSQYTEITKSKSIEILELEKDFNATIQVNNIGNIPIKGKVDRLERRDSGEIFIVDYKTSSDPSQYKVKWDKFDPADYNTWKDAIKSIQMIFYIYLLDSDTNCTHKPTNTSIILVKERDVKKAEARLFEDSNDTYKTHIPKIINTLITDIITLPEFKPTDDPKDCNRCNYKDICWR